jgi:hypothetical protein
MGVIAHMKLSRTSPFWRYLCCLLVSTICLVEQGDAQTAKVQEITLARPTLKKDRYVVAVIAPLYLDSFDLAKNVTAIPDFASPGIDFYKGIQLAADTMHAAGKALDIHVYDSKSKYLNLEKLIATKKFDSVDCIIGDVGGAEIKVLAAFCKSKNIVLASAVSPNDGEQVGNPNFVLLQPRLQTHMQRARKFIQSKYPSANYVFCKQSGNAAETKAWNYYNNDVSTLTKNTRLLDMKSDVLNATELEKYFAKDIKNVVFLANLDVDIAEANLAVVLELKAAGFDVAIVGMPTWTGIDLLSDQEQIGDIDIYVTTPYMLEQLNPNQTYVAKQYEQQMGTKASPIVYKGFDAMYYFGNLLCDQGLPIINSLMKQNQSFCTPYAIGPANDNEVFKYYENKFLYMAHFKRGTILYE